MTRGEVREQYERGLLPGQMGQDGSFPKELVRTKPYSYSIFNFDVMAMICQSLADGGEDLFKYRTADGRGICKGATFLYPYLRDKAAWPYAKMWSTSTRFRCGRPGCCSRDLRAITRSTCCYGRAWIRIQRMLRLSVNYPVRQPLLWFP